MTPTEEALKNLQIHLEKEGDLIGLELLSHLLDVTIEKNKWILAALKVALAKMKSTGERRAEHRMSPSAEIGVPNDTSNGASIVQPDSQPGQTD